jgi:hypothetical protein
VKRLHFWGEGSGFDRGLCRLSLWYLFHKSGYRLATGPCAWPRKSGLPQSAHWERHRQDDAGRNRILSRAGGMPPMAAGP